MRSVRSERSSRPEPLNRVADSVHDEAAVVGGCALDIELHGLGDRGMKIQLRADRGARSWLHRNRAAPGSSPERAGSSDVPQVTSWDVDKVHRRDRVSFCQGRGTSVWQSIVPLGVPEHRQQLRIPFEIHGRGHLYQRRKLGVRLPGDLVCASRFAIGIPPRQQLQLLKCVCRPGDDRRFW